MLDSRWVASPPSVAKPAVTATIDRALLIERARPGNPDPRSALGVLADCLQEDGDPRGWAIAHALGDSALVPVGIERCGAPRQPCDVAVFAFAPFARALGSPTRALDAELVLVTPLGVDLSRPGTPSPDLLVARVPLSARVAYRLLGLGWYMASPHVPMQLGGNEARLQARLREWGLSIIDRATWSYCTRRGGGHGRPNDLGLCGVGSLEVVDGPYGPCLADPAVASILAYVPESALALAAVRPVRRLRAGDHGSFGHSASLQAASATTSASATRRARSANPQCSGPVRTRSSP